MKEQANKHLDNLAKRIIKDSELQSPSLNFVDNVMARVNELAQSKTTVYRPLISKKVWALIISVAALIVVAAIFNGNSTNGFALPERFILSRFSFGNLLEGFSSIQLSEAFIYALIFFGIMLSLQMSFLKHYFDKRIEG